MEIGEDMDHYSQQDLCSISFFYPTKNAMNAKVLYVIHGR